jgi:hypothetical protein
MLIGNEWARRKGYLIFESTPLDQVSEPQSPIKLDEQVVGWAFGPFAVGAKQKYLINVAAQLSYVRTREHIVMARVEKTRFLLLASSANGDAGWWYTFFMPDRVKRVETGYIWCGIKVRPGLALSYQTREMPDQKVTIYLTFADVDRVQRVVADLRIDVPLQAIVNR